MSNSYSSLRAGRSVAAVAAVAGALALAACGGGGGDAGPPAVTDSVPATATGSVSGLITYMLALVAIKDDTLKPIDLSGVAPLPTDDTAQPTPLPAA